MKLTKAQDDLLRYLADGGEIFRHYTEKRQGTGRNARFTVVYKYRVAGKALNAKTFQALQDAGYVSRVNNPASMFVAVRFAISAKGKTRAAGEEA